MEDGPQSLHWDILPNSFRLLIEHSGAALRYSLLPFAMIFALNRLTAIVWPQGMAAAGWHVLYTAAYVVPMAVLLVPWYRLLLSSARPELAAPPAQGWYIAFAGRTLGLELMLAGILMPSLIAQLLAEARGDDAQLMQLSLVLRLALVPGFYLYARAALALPASASGDDRSYGRSLQATAPVGWRLALIVMAIWLTFQIVGVALSGGGETEGPPPPPPVLKSAVVAAIAILNELVIAAALAQAYLRLEGRER